jgi:hypothetical protein
MASITQEDRAKKELQLRLYQIDLDRGLSPAEAAARARQALERIVRSMSRRADYKRNDILGNEHYSQRIDAHIGALRPQEDWIRHLVHSETGRSVIPGAKQRAIQLLCGARPNPRKSKIEIQAVELANKIRRTWFVSRAGRPPGARGLPRGSRGRDDDIPIFDASEVRLSIRDIVKIAAEAIGNNAGAEIDFSNATAKAALKAAILILRPNAGRSVDREIAFYLAASDNLLKSH